MDQLQRLRVLFARLAIPLPTVRWWVYAEIATLLQTAESSRATWTMLCANMSRQLLESNVVERLTPVLMLGHAPPDRIQELRQNIQAPSMLSDYALGVALGVPVVMPTWLTGHSGPIAAEFRVSDADREKWGGRVREREIPRLARLGEGANLPALERFEYEMARLTRSYASHPGHHPYFAPGHYQQGAVGPLDGNADHVWRSAYLRTFAYLVAEHGCPMRAAAMYCADLFPVVPALRRLAPPAARPPWLPGPIHTSDSTSIEGWLAAAAKVVSSRSEGRDALASIDAAVVRSGNLQVDVTAVLVIASACDASSVFSTGLYELRANWSDAAPTDTVRVSLPKAGTQVITGASRLVAAPLPMGWTGYLQAEVLTRSPWSLVPQSAEEVCGLAVSPDATSIQFARAGEVLGEAIFWNAEWEPLHLAALGPSASTATIVRCSRLREVQRIANLTTVWLAWKATILSRDRDYGDFEKRQSSGCIALAV